MEKNLSPLQKILTLVIRFYQLALSPLLGQRCRFHPTCSQYAIESIKLHGGVKGSWLTVKRLLKCHPFSEGGLDPVQQPETGHSQDSTYNQTNKTQEK